MKRLCYCINWVCSVLLIFSSSYLNHSGVVYLACEQALGGMEGERKEEVSVIMNI